MARVEELLMGRGKAGISGASGALWVAGGSGGVLGMRVPTRAGPGPL